MKRHRFPCSRRAWLAGCRWSKSLKTAKAEIVLSETGEIIPMPRKDTDLVVPGKASPVGLSLPDGLSYSEWRGIGDNLKSIESGILWWIGDWLRYGEKRYGEKYKEAVEATGYSYQTLKGRPRKAIKGRPDDSQDNQAQGSEDRDRCVNGDLVASLFAWHRNAARVGAGSRNSRSGRIIRPSSRQPTFIAESRGRRRRRYSRLSQNDRPQPRV